jgi:hypothetical protein
MHDATIAPKSKSRRVKQANSGTSQARCRVETYGAKADTTDLLASIVGSCSRFRIMVDLEYDA